ncbi:MAG: hypothetical protein IJ486_07425 [Firmicutes bacterium]|nr:hypothetical protein [Bacillota bacterium]
MENKTEQVFTYTYCAQEQAELKRLREKYAPKDPTENKMDQLRMMDRKVESVGRAKALTLGIMGTLMLGIGMCCTMVWTEVAFIPGIAIGIIGIAVLSMAYPVYRSVTRKEREKIAPEMMRLIEELEK